MKLKRLKFPKRRRRKKNVQDSETIGYKCLLLGQNITAKDEFLDELNEIDGKETGRHNECILKTDSSECVFWKVDPLCEKNKACIKQYLDFHSPDIIFYFIDVGGDDPTELELMILQLGALMEVIQEDQNFCIVVDKAYIDVINDLNLDQDLFKESILRLINFKIDFEFEFCFSSIDEMKQILDNLNTTTAAVAIPTESEYCQEEIDEDDPIWDEFCDIGGCEEFFLTPLPVVKVHLEEQGSVEDVHGDVTEEEDNGSWLGRSGHNVVESF